MLLRMLLLAKVITNVFDALKQELAIGRLLCFKRSSLLDLIQSKEWRQSFRGESEI